jgi:hypothetical protein
VVRAEKTFLGRRHLRRLDERLRQIDQQRNPYNHFVTRPPGAPETEMRDFSPASGLGVDAHDRSAVLPAFAIDLPYLGDAQFCEL